MNISLALTMERMLACSEYFDDEAPGNFAAVAAINYNKAIARSIWLTGGVYFRSALNSYLELTDYRPHAFGAQVGVQYRFQRQ